jgi:peptidoglycan/LPS O-acetylase OafA/YrhL
MMLLGVCRHAAINYDPTVIEGWPYTDPQTDLLVHWVIVFIRVFQLPVFFAIAGFFAGYMVEAHGVKAFLSQRWSRIGVTLLAAWPVLAGVMYFLLAFAPKFSAVPPTESVAEVMANRSVDAVDSYLLMHLWFLYDLMILCIVASAAWLLAQRIPAGARRRALDLFERRVHREGMAVLVVVGGVILYQMRSWSIDYHAGILPPLRLLGLHGLFFAFGWLLYCRRATLEGFKRSAWIHFAVGAICFFVYRHFLEVGCDPDPASACMGTSDIHHLGTVVFISLSMWHFVYGLFGLFLRYLNKPSRRWRYMADASYWIYLVHLPVVMSLPLLLTSAPLPAVVKLALVVAGANGLALVTYRYCVRPTFIGNQLNGRRHPRAAT